MSAEAAVRTVRTLIDYYGEKSTDEQRAFWVKKLSRFSPQELAEVEDQVRIRFKRLPSLDEILRLAHEAGARRCAIEARQGDGRAKDFFRPERAPGEFARDAVTAINEIISASGLSREKYLTKKYEVANAFLKKYPNSDEDGALRSMMREAARDLRELLEQEARAS